FGICPFALHDALPISVGLGFHARRDGGARSGATDVERAHRQLRARLADGLSSNHTHGFAEVDQAATAQVAAVATGAQAVAGFTRSEEHTSVLQSREKL